MSVRSDSARRRFRPSLVRLLFIGESPPASGRFFYHGDSGLYRAMRDTFRAVDPGIDDENFLPVFQASGCYLIDLCPEPVDHLSSELRRAACRAGEAKLSRTIARLQPLMIATVVRSIERNVTRASCRAGWHGPFIHLPYPGRWSRYRKVFLDTLAPSISSLRGGIGLTHRLADADARYGQLHGLVGGEVLVGLQHPGVSLIEIEKPGAVGPVGAF